MNIDRDFERVIRAWAAEGLHELPEASLEAALQEIATTPQRRVGWLLRIFPFVGGYQLTAATAAVAVVAAVIVGYLLLPGRIPGPPVATPVLTPRPVPTATPTAPPPLASGQFEAFFGTVEVAATGHGADVSGSFEVSSSRRRHFSVKLGCSLTYDTGMILIGGTVTESTQPDVAAGKRVALALKPGKRVKAILWFEGRRPAPNCSVFLIRAPNDFSDFLAPITGIVDFGRER